MHRHDAPKTYGLATRTRREKPDLAVDNDVQRLEAERLRPVPKDPDRLGDLFAQLLGLIAAECRRAGYLPKTST